MTNQELASRLSDWMDKITANTLALSFNQIIDVQLEQELDELNKKAQQQSLLDIGSQKQRQAILALISGLHIWNGSMDSSHKISQNLENKTGSYLHGLLHRMEPDYSNAKYWFRRAGGHPRGEQVQQGTLEILRDSNSDNSILFQSFSREKSWNPELLTDIIAATLKSPLNADEVTILEQIQAIELRLLMETVLRELDNS